MAMRNAEMRMTPKYFWCFNRYIDLSKIGKEERITLKKILNHYNSISAHASPFNNTVNGNNRYLREVEGQFCSHYDTLLSMLFSVHHLFNAPLEVLEGYSSNNHLL